MRRISKTMQVLVMLLAGVALIVLALVLARPGKAPGLIAQVFPSPKQDGGLPYPLPEITGKLATAPPRESAYPPPESTRIETPSPEPTPRSSDTPTPIRSPRIYRTPEWTPYVDEPFTIIYVRGGELWMSEVGGRGELQLTNEGIRASEGPALGVISFDVSPTGRHVAYVVHAEDTRYAKVLDIRDGTTRLLSPADEPFGVIDYGRTGPQAWWGETLVGYYGGPAGSESPGDLVIVNLETGERSVHPDAYVQWPSPDGRYVYTYIDSKMQLQDTRTGERWPVPEKSEGVVFVGWSPDSRYLLLSVFYRREEATAGKEVELLIVVDAQTREQRVISSPNKIASGARAAWSPDGQTVIFMECDSPRSACVHPELWLASKDGTNRRQIPMEKAVSFSDPCWTPDGNRIVFSREDEGTWVLSLADGSLNQVCAEDVDFAVTR